MTTIKTYPHIAKQNGEPARLVSHPRTRVAILVMDYLSRGLGPEEMVCHYPYLKLAEVHSAMAYYHDNPQEIDEEIQAELDHLHQETKARPRSPIWLLLRAKGLV